MQEDNCAWLTSQRYIFYDGSSFRFWRECQRCMATPNRSVIIDYLLYCCSFHSVMFSFKLNWILLWKLGLLTLFAIQNYTWDVLILDLWSCKLAARTMLNIDFLSNAFRIWLLTFRLEMKGIFHEAGGFVHFPGNSLILCNLFLGWWSVWPFQRPRSDKEVALNRPPTWKFNNSP